MGNLVFYEETSEVLAKKVAALVIEQLKEVLPVQEKAFHYLSRNETASRLNISTPTLDTYTSQGLLIKYGSGKRARYILEEVEAAKASIYNIKHKKRKF